MPTLKYTNLLPNTTQFIGGPAIFLNLNQIPDDNGKVLPLGAAIVSVVVDASTFVDNSNQPMNSTFAIQAFLPPPNSANHILTDTRNRSAQVISTPTKPNIFINGIPSIPTPQMSDLLPTNGGATEDSFVNEICKDIPINDLWFSWPQFAITPIDQDKPITITFTYATTTLPTFIDEAKVDPNFIYPVTFNQFLEYDIASFPFGVSIGCQQDNLGRVMQNWEYPVAVNLVADPTGTYSVVSFGIGLRAEITRQANYGVLAGSGDPVTTFPPFGPISQINTSWDLTFTNSIGTTFTPQFGAPPDPGTRKLGQFLNTYMDSYEQLIRCDLTAGPNAPAKLQIRLGEIPDAYRDYLPDLPPQVLPAPPIVYP
jgi:hypothetical protein